VMKRPKELGYEFGRSSCYRPATHLAKETGIKLSGEQVREDTQAKKSTFTFGHTA